MVIKIDHSKTINKITHILLPSSLHRKQNVVTVNSQLLFGEDSWCKKVILLQL